MIRFTLKLPDKTLDVEVRPERGDEYPRWSCWPLKDLHGHIITITIGNLTEPKRSIRADRMLILPTKGKGKHTNAN
jgi:hypothetical protein